MDITYSEALIKPLNNDNEIIAALAKDAVGRDQNVKRAYADPKGKIWATPEVITAILNKKLKTIIDPILSFKTDPTRILRMITTSVEDKMELSPEIKRAIMTCAPLLLVKKAEKKEEENGLAPNLINDRMKRIFNGHSMREKLSLMQELSLLKTLFPLLEKSHTDWLDHILLSPPKNVNVRQLDLLYLAILTAYHDVNPNTTNDDVTLIFRYFYVDVDHKNPRSKNEIPDALKLLGESLTAFKEHTNRIKFLNSSFSLFGKQLKTSPLPAFLSSLTPRFA